MFSFDLGIIGTAFIAFAVVSRPYILKKMKKEGTGINVVYFVLVMVLAFPLYVLQGKFTFSALNDTNAHELASNILQNPSLHEFHSLQKVTWLPYDEKRNLYAIKANLTKNETPYSLYFLAQCEFSQGCSTTLNQLMILPSHYKEIPLNHIDEQLFATRDCNDEVIKSFWLKKNIDDAFKILFEQYSKVDATQTIYTPELFEFSSFTPKAFDQSDTNTQNRTHLLSCQGDFILKGRFSIMQSNKEFAPSILPLIFDEAKADNDSFIIKSRMTYDLFQDNNDNLMVFAQPFQTEKIKALSQ